MKVKNKKDEPKLLNCIREVQIDEKMAWISLYDDLPHFEYDTTIDKLKDSNTKLQKSVYELKQQIRELEKESLQFKSANLILSKNITSLFKTAYNEIQRKDKIIDDLRKSQINKPLQLEPTSKMFSFSNSLQSEQTQSNKPKQNIQPMPNIVDQSKVLNQFNGDNITNSVIEPSHDVPKTVYFKRLCQKLTNQNKTSKIKNMSKCIENSNSITNKITCDKNESFSNNENVPREMANSIINNDSYKNVNSTLVVCESDVTHITPNCELDTTPVIQCSNLVKDKENVSSESFCSKLKQSPKSKKSMIITPSTIGVQSISCNPHVKIFNTNNKDSNCPNKNNQSIIEELHTKNDSIIVKQFSKANMDHDQILSTSEIKTQTSFMNIEVEQIPVRRKRVVIQKNTNGTSKVIVRKSSRVTCLSPSVDNSLNMSTKNVKCLSINYENGSCSPKQNNSKLECELPNNYLDSNLKKFLQSNINIENCPKNTNEKSLCDNINIPSINIEIEQFPIRREKVFIKRNDAPAVIQVRKSIHSTSLNSSNEEESNVSTKNVKCLSIDYEKELCSPLAEKNNQSKDELSVINDVSNLKEYPLENYQFNKSISSTVEPSLVDNVSLPSISIEVEQGSMFRRSNGRKVTMCLNQDKNKLDIKKGRRVKLITIKDHYSQPLPSFNGAKKTEIDVSKKSVHIEKVVESSSHFYVPQVKRRRPMNFSSTDL